MPPSRLLGLGLLFFALTACGELLPSSALPHRAMFTPAPEPSTPPAPGDDTAAIDREVAARMNARLDIVGPWRPMAWGASYLLPDDVVAKDGGVDVIVHFHGAQVVDEEWRASGLSAVIVSVTLPGYGVMPYREMFALPDTFGAIVDDAVKRAGGKRVRRLALVSWSAGYGATEDVLQNAHYYDMVDTVVVLDGMHADYVDGLPDEGDIAIFERFARDAVANPDSRQMIVTHSAVTPPGYASTTETATMLLAAAGVARVEEKLTNARGMLEWYHADSGGLHVRGFRGDGPHDHMDQVHLLGDVIRTFVAPRWTRMAVTEERRAGGEARMSPR